MFVRARSNLADCAAVLCLSILAEARCWMIAAG